MNDLDPNHYSQYSKRYGNNFTEADIEKISLIGAALSSNSIENVSTLHFMADTLSASTNSHAKHSYIRAQIFSNFLVELHHSAFDGGVDDPDKSSLRTKLGNIMDALTSTTGCNISSAAALANVIRKSYSDLELIQDNSTEPHRTMPILQSLPSESQTELYNRLRHENSRALGLALKPASLERVLLGNDSRFVCDSSMSLSPEGSGQELSATTPVNFPSDELDVNDILIANIIDDDSEVALRSLEKFRRRMGELTSAEPLLEFPLDDLNDDIF